MREFVKQVERGDLVGRSSAQESADSHLITFAAEHSRVIGQTVNFDDYVRQLMAGSAV
jgi:hypothetical protein